MSYIYAAKQSKTVEIVTIKMTKNEQTWPPFYDSIHQEILYFNYISKEYPADSSKTNRKNEQNS